MPGLPKISHNNANIKCFSPESRKDSEVSLSRMNRYIQSSASEAAKLTMAHFLSNCSGKQMTPANVLYIKKKKKSEEVFQMQYVIALTHAKIYYFA